MSEQGNQRVESKSGSDGDASLFSGTFYVVATSVAAFREQHPGWLEALEGAGPVYRLPVHTISAFKKPPVGREAIQSDAEASDEIAFANLCEFHEAIGLWNQRFVSPSYLTRPRPLSEERMKALGWKPSEIRQAQIAAKKVDSLWLRLKGYVGWLLTEPSFLRARNDLAARWNALPEECRPGRIIRSITLKNVPSGAKRVGPEVAEYQTALNAFLDRWGLTEMLTWDLPDPQGPFLSTTLPADAPAMPRHCVHLVLPLHCPLTGTDDLLQRIRREQIRRAKELALDPSMAGLAHHEVYGRMLEVDFLERVIRSRYYRPGRRRGFVTVVEHVIAETLKISEHQVQRLRKAIVGCRMGKRASVEWLRADRG